MIASITRTPADLLVTLSESTHQLTTLPLREVSRKLLPQRDRLQAAWKALSAATLTHPDTLANIFLILSETVPDLTAPTTVPPLPLTWQHPPTPPKPTRAHPRAFKGTKSQPPKPPKPEPIDLRPHLNHPRAQRALLKLLNHSIAPPDPWSFPPHFVTHLWPSVRHRTQRDQSKLLATYNQLSLDANPTQLAAFVRLVLLAGAPIATAWGDLCAILPPPRQTPFLEALIESRAYSTQPTYATADLLIETNHLATDRTFSNWVHQLLLNLNHPAYLMAGFRIAHTFNPNQTFHNIGACSDFPEDDIQAIGAQQDDHDWLPNALWRSCGDLPGLSSHLRKSQWRRFTPQAALAWFEFLIRIDYSSTPPAKTAILRLLPQIEALALATPPDYQYKAIQCLTYWITTWNHPASKFRQAVQLLQRITKPPYSTQDQADIALLPFLDLESGADRERFLTAPDSSLQALENACRRDNDARLISRGLETLTRFQPAFTTDALRTEPKRLCHTAKLLGGLSRPIQRQLLDDWANHPVRQLNPTQMPLQQFCEALLPHITGKILNPIPARLTAHLKAGIPLTTASLERHRRVISSKWPLTQLTLLEHQIFAWLKRDLPPIPVTANEEHALRLLGNLHENRTGLRKFLKAYWAGNRKYLANHPATLAWRKRHPKVNHTFWDQGIPFEGIQIETDPLEILKLGTYVGSCLSIGGLCADSAVAALLDANKRVLYARDSRGQVLARQLIAISNDDQLVCFEVYPRSASNQLKSRFRDYDFALAAALGIPVYEPAKTDQGYEIACILSVYWWDDDSWDFDLPASVQLDPPVNLPKRKNTSNRRQ